MSEIKPTETNANNQKEAIAKVSYSSYKVVSSKGFQLMILCEKDGKKVMLKALKEEFRDRLPMRNALKKEFKNCMNLSHPGVVRYVQLVETPEYGLAIEEEYIEGRTLQAYLTERHIDDDKIAIVNQIASALQYIHNQGVIHRNLKPSNIMITKQGDTVKIIDFNVLSIEELKPSADSIRFIAPELKDETMAADSTADIYSLGTIMKAMGLTLAHSEVIKRCCAFKKSERYTSVDEFLRDFNNEKSSLSFSMPRISGGAIKIFSIALLFIGLIVAIFFFKDTIQQQFSKLNPSELFKGNEVKAIPDSVPVTIAQPDTATTPIEPKAEGKMAFLNTMKPALYNDLDRIFSKFEGKSLTPDSKTELNIRIKKYYKGLIQANDTLDNEQRLELDRVFGDYVKQKKANLK